MPGWQLVDEAELAVVVAGLDPVEDRRVEPDPERRPGALSIVDVPCPGRPGRTVSIDVGLVDELLVLDDVGGQHPVDREQLVADRETGGRGGAAGNHLERWSGTT